MPVVEGLFGSSCLILIVMTSYLYHMNEHLGLYISSGNVMKLDFIFGREGVDFQLWMCHSNPTAFSMEAILRNSCIYIYIYILTDPTEVNTQYVTVC